MDFDTAKENIQPLRQGRRADRLEAALETNKEQIEVEKRQHEEAIRNYEGPDPLALWFEYISFIEQSYPSSGAESGLNDVVTKCILEFENDERYRQDRRMIKLFIKYIDTQDEPQECYEKLYNNGIGSMVADLYIAWSYYYDAANDFKKTEAIFQKGFDAGAEPMDDLKQAHMAFSISMSQRMLYDDDNSKQQFQQQMREKRSVMTTLRAYKKKYVGSVRTGIAIRDENPGVVNQENQGSNTRKNALEVHEDEGHEAAALPASTSVIRSIIDSGRKKENVHEPGPWNKAKVGKHGKLFGSSAAAVQTPSFDIPEDDDLVPIPCPVVYYGKDVTLPPNWVSKNAPQKPWDIPIYIEEPVVPRSIPCYEKFLLYPNTETEISPEEYRAYKWLMDRGMRAKITEEFEKVWTNVLETGVRIPPGFSTSNVKEKDDGKIPLFIASEEDSQFQMPLNKMYPGNGEVFSFEELRAEKFRKGEINILTEEDFEEVNDDEMDMTVIGDRRYSIHPGSRKSIVPRKSIMPRKSVMPPPSPVKEEDEDANDSSVQEVFVQPTGAIRKRKSDEKSVEFLAKREFIGETPPRSAFASENVFKPPAPPVDRKLSIRPYPFEMLDEDETCSTQQFNFFLKAQSVSTPVSKKSSARIEPETPVAFEEKPADLSPSTSHAAVMPKQLSTIMETTETTQSTKSSVSSHFEADLYPKLSHVDLIPNSSTQQLAVQQEIEKRFFMPVLDNIRIPEDQTETCAKITLQKLPPVGDVNMTQPRLLTSMKSFKFDEPAFEAFPTEQEDSMKAGSFMIPPPNMTRLDIPESPEDEVSELDGDKTKVPESAEPNVVVSENFGSSVSEKNEASQAQKSEIQEIQKNVSQSIKLLENSMTKLPTHESQDFNVPETQQLEVPETQEFEIPQTQNFKIPESQDFEIPETQDFENPETQDPEIQNTQNCSQNSQKLIVSKNQSFAPSTSKSFRNQSQKEVSQLQAPEIFEKTLIPEVPGRDLSQVFIPATQDCSAGKIENIPESQEIDVPQTQEIDVPEIQFEVPETQEFEIPETQDMEIPASQDFEIPATQEPEVSTQQNLQKSGLQKPEKPALNFSAGFNIYEDSVMEPIPALPATPGKFLADDEGTGFLHVSRKENLAMQPPASAVKRTASDEFLQLLDSPQMKTGTSKSISTSEKRNEISDLLKFSTGGQALETSLKKLSIEPPKSATPTNFFDDDLNTEKFQLGNLKNSTLLPEMAPKQAPITFENDFDLSIAFEADEMERLGFLPESRKAPEPAFKVPALPSLKITKPTPVIPSVNTNFQVFEDEEIGEDLGRSIYVEKPQAQVEEIEDEEWETDKMASFIADAFNRYEHTIVDENLDTSLKVREAIIKSKGNPFDEDLREAILEYCTFSNYLENFSQNTCTLVATLPQLKVGKNVDCGPESFNVEKLIAKGGFGSVYLAKNLRSGRLVAMKQEKPACLWEYYILVELHDRLKNKNMAQAFMKVECAAVGNNASVLVTAFSKYGTILDMCKKYRLYSGKNVDEYVVVLLTSQLISIIDHLHACRIIHGDIKPDNFLMMSKIEYGSRLPCLQLIDFGSAIDMDNYKNNETFNFVVTTENFTCCEMLEKKPWTYQTDLFGLAGTAFVMLFGRYMDVEKKVNVWVPKVSYPRYVDKHLWEDFFNVLLNVQICRLMPNLQSLKRTFDEKIAQKERYVIDKINDFNKAF